MQDPALLRQGARSRMPAGFREAHSLKGLCMQAELTLLVALFLVWLSGGSSAPVTF